MSFSSLPWKVTAVVAALVASSSSIPVLAEEPATVKVTAQDLTLQVPKTWKQQEPSNNLRLAQFVIAPPGGEGESAELVVSGPFGGSVPDNVKRWIDQFQSTGRTVTMVQGEGPQGKYVLVDLAGTFNKPIGPPIMRKSSPVEGYRTLAAMVMTDKGNYFVKLTGPEATVAPQVSDFRKSFGGSVEKETKYEF